MMDKRLAILQYGRVGPSDADDWLTSTAVSAERFQAQLSVIQQLQWDVIGAEALVAALSFPDSVAGRSLVLTFDGARRDFLDHGLPVLRRFRFPALMFVPSSFVGKRLMIDMEADEPEPICDWGELRYLESESVSIQSMGVTGRRFSGLEPADIEREVTESRRVLGAGLEKTVELFAYPHGDPGSRPADVCGVLEEAGYAAACTSGDEPNPLPPEDPYRLSRIPIEPDSDLAALLARD